MGMPVIGLWSFGSQESASHRYLVNLADGKEFVLNSSGVSFNIINDGFVGGVVRRRGSMYGIRITDGAVEKVGYLEAFDFVIYSSPYAMALANAATLGRYSDKMFCVEDAIDIPTFMLERNSLRVLKYVSFCNPENLSHRLFDFDVTIYTSRIEHPMVRDWRYERIGEYNWFDAAIILHRSPGEDKYRAKSLNRLAQSFYFGLDVITNYEIVYGSRELEADFAARTVLAGPGLLKIVDTRSLFDRHFSHERLRGRYREIRDQVCRGSS